MIRVIKKDGTKEDFNVQKVVVAVNKSAYRALIKFTDAIANRGYYFVPHVVKKIQGEPLDTMYTRKHYTMVSSENYELIVQGMRRAVLQGTCRSANIPGIEVCGKTGTAQNRGHDHSVFMGFAPMNNPKIAIAVYVENGGFGAVYGVPIGALMMEQYLKGKLSPENEIRAEEYSNRVIMYGNEER